MPKTPPLIRFAELTEPPHPALFVCVPPLQVPYMPSSAQQVANVMALLRGRSGKTADLGSGDGRLVRGGLERATGKEGSTKAPPVWGSPGAGCWQHPPGVALGASSRVGQPGGKP